MEVYASANPISYRISLERRRMGRRKGFVGGVADGA